MEKNKKLGFFQKIVLSMTDFRVYPYILKTEKLSRSFGHFLCFMMILVALMTGKYAAGLFQRIDKFMEEYDSVVPEFTLNNGVLDITQKDTVIIQGDTVAVIDTQNSFSTFLESEEYKNITRYDRRLFINSDMITYETYDGARTSFLLSQVTMNFDKASFYEYILEVYQSDLTKLTMVLTIFMAVFVGYFSIKLLEVLLFAIFASLVAVIYRIRVDFKNYLKIALYIVTLPYLIETVSILVVGSIRDYTVFASNILAYIYIFYAIRAVKLDAFLLIMNHQNASNVNVVNLNEESNTESKENEDSTDSTKQKKEEHESSNKEDNEDKNGG